MLDIQDIVKGFKTAESRWARFGPYYAMFPVDFAFEVVSKYSKVGDYILDPFAGRYSSIYASSVLGRYGVGIEINPVGWLYGKAKLNPAPKDDVKCRLIEIYKNRKRYSNEIKRMPEFYRICYCDEVLEFLLSARNDLKWKKSNIDSTLMSIILVSLHNKIGAGLSNQMRMTKSMGMNYSINWWKKNGFENPPNINPLEMLLNKIEWRYTKGMPKLNKNKAILGDSTIELKKMHKSYTNKKFSLLFTSPPYCAITDYHVDQWLRLWMLGGNFAPKTIPEKHKGKFSNKEEYYVLLDTVFNLSSKLMNTNSVIYVRTDRRAFTYYTTLEVLKKNFPSHTINIIQKPFNKDTKTQTKLYGDKTLKPGEVDIILSNDS